MTDTALSFFGWSISDNSKVGRLLPEFTVSEKDYIVIAADSNIVSLANPEMHFIVPTSFPALNNNGDGIFIYDMTGHIIDSLVYDSDTWPVSSEVSTEKQRPAFLSNTANHWTQTPDSIAMTPGYPNVTMWQNIDGNVLQNSIFHSPLYPSPNTPFQMEIGIRNSGVLPFVGKISILENSVELTSGNFSTIQSRDTSLVQIDIPGITSGIHPLEIQLDIDGDENSRNDWAHDTVKVSYPFGTVLLNEFLSEPNIDQTEFMEIYFPQSLDLGDWTISDRSKVLKPIPDILVSQNQYLVLAQDSIIYEYVEMNKFVIPMNENWPTLNNSSDGIFIYDMTGQVIDSLVYSDNWPILAGRSTEKFRPDYISNDSSRWALTVDANAMTPGKQNSIFYESLAESGWIDLAPNSFSPDGDGMDDVLNIRYQLPFEQAAITINIFDATGRKISTPYWNRASSQEGLLYWNGLRSNGKPARIGIYILKFEARNGSSGRIWEDIQTVVLAKPL